MSDTFRPMPSPPFASLQGKLAHKLGLGDVAEATHVKAGDPPIRVSRIALAEYAGLAAAFDDLALRAEDANPFMSPALVGAVATGIDAREIVVLAAFDAGDADRLLGAWCLRRQRDIWSFGTEVLQVPVLPRYECLSAPVLDIARATGTFAAMLAHVAASSDLPKVIRATAWPGPLEALLPAGWRAYPAETWARAVMQPVAGSTSESYLRQSMGKSLNKRNNRQKQLSDIGQLTAVALRGAEATAAFEHYVKLEAGGWKGRMGTSLSEVPEDAAYMRQAIRNLADANHLSVDMIMLNGKPIAVGVVIETAGRNLFWKAAFDEAYARFAPGSLLHLAVTRRLFAEGRAALDSCMMEFTSPLHLPWSERMDMARVTIAREHDIAGRPARVGARLRHALRRFRHRQGRN